MTSDTDVAWGLASTPSSWTLAPAGPSSCRASTMLTVVSGHTVVHSESTKARMTTLPRNWCSDMRWPNWLSSVMSGAGWPPSELPGSRAGLPAAARAWLPPGAPEPVWPPGSDAVPPKQPASSTVARSTGTSSAGARSAGRTTAVPGVRSSARPGRLAGPGAGCVPHPDHAAAAFPGCLRLVRDHPVKLVAELAGNGGAGGVGLVAVDLDPPHPRELERDGGQRLGRGRPEAAAGLVLGDPVADLDSTVAHPPVQPDGPDQHVFPGGEHRVDVVGARRPHLVGFGHPGPLGPRVGRIRVRPRHPRAQVLHAPADRGCDRAGVGRAHPAQDEHAGVN